MLHPHPDAGEETADPHHSEISVAQRRTDSAGFTVCALRLRRRVHRGRFDATSLGRHSACWSTRTSPNVTIMTECKLIHRLQLRPQRPTLIVAVRVMALSLSVRYVLVISRQNMRTLNAARVVGVIVVATSETA